MRDVMADLETMGRSPDGAIVAIGAVAFDLRTGERGDTFYRTVCLVSSADAGGSIDPGTVLWWMQQPEEARIEIITAETPLYLALEEFGAWFPNKARIWGNGATFDLVILRAAYNALGYKVPWHHRVERDVRTLVGLWHDVVHDVGDAKPEERHKFAAEKHHALRDAERQVEYCCQMYKIFADAARALKQRGSEFPAS